MLYLIQENVFREENYDLIFESLNKLGLEYETIPSPEDVIKYETERKDVFCFGSVRLARLATQQKWIPGSFYGGNHDFEIYRKYYKENLLNYDCSIHNISDVLEWKKNELKFIRPTKDSKLFTGGIFSELKWEDKRLNVIDFISKSHTSAVGTIQVGSIKKIYKEARIWIIDGKIVTSSYYQFHNGYVFESEVSEEGLEFAQTMVDLYQVAEAFVMDICLTPDGWKIVEINCINCAGFYKGDLQKILIALEDKYNPI